MAALRPGCRLALCRELTKLHEQVISGSVEEVLAAQGFNGIAVALLAMSNPLGIILTGLFIGHITVGGGHLQTLRYMKEIIEVIIGMIIYFSAFSLLVRDLIARLRRARAQRADTAQEEER